MRKIHKTIARGRAAGTLERDALALLLEIRTAINGHQYPEVGSCVMRKIHKTIARGRAGSLDGLSRDMLELLLEARDAINSHRTIDCIASVAIAPEVRSLIPLPAGAWGRVPDPVLIASSPALMAPAPAGAFGYVNDVGLERIDLGSVGTWVENWTPEGSNVVLASTMRSFGSAPPAVTFIDKPTESTGLWLQIRNSGTRGEVYFGWSTDDGGYWYPDVLIPSHGVVDLGNGYLMQFASGSYVEDDVYKAGVATWKGRLGYNANSYDVPPVYSSVAWNGKPCLTFTGGLGIGRREHLVCTTAGLLSSFSGNDNDCVMACATDVGQGSPVPYQMVLCGLFGSTGAHHAAIHVNDDYSNNREEYIYKRYPGALSGYVAAGWDRRHVICENVGTSAVVYHNGDELASGTLNGDSMTFERFTIGAIQYSSSVLSPCVGNIAAVSLGTELSSASGLSSVYSALGIPYYSS